MPAYYSCYTFFLRNDIITAVKHKMQGVGYHFIEPLIKKDILLMHIFKNFILSFILLKLKCIKSFLW